MRVDTCLLADSVAVPPDGKFYIQGGGVSRIQAPAFPFRTPALAILVRLHLDESEAGVRHRYAFRFVDDGDVELAPPLEFTAEPNKLTPLEEGEERFAVIAANVAGLAFHHPGPHRLEFRADGELLTSVSFAVVKTSEGGPATTS